MNEQEEKPIVELLPPLNKKCQMIVVLLRAAFTLVPIFLGIWAWLEFGWLYGLLVWLAAVFAGMIILSKLKIAYIPFNQHELSHSATAILKWYVTKRICD
ncbi:hypothetical protein [Hydrogenimonas cancrithermarum]|uniref:Uncharacterized protein n=1 Tax=Hydrogenimonas cancrithermarum TaxID=2993563 RepID=A0ABM8FHQ4_9BACT|nr:hypothetical protein [Hydrogenimonas cancrithermarum]BDY11799.1 hypothetical protein HCR_01110 [Hydrogenimonas cancrithermarum]